MSRQLLAVLLGAILLGACAQRSDNTAKVHLPLCDGGAPDARWQLVALTMAGDTARPVLVCSTGKVR